MTRLRLNAHIVSQAIWIDVANKCLIDRNDDSGGSKLESLFSGLRNVSSSGVQNINVENGAMSAAASQLELNI